MCGQFPSLALPRRTLLPRPSNTDAHDCEHAATGGRMGAPVYAEADKTRFRLTWFFSFTLAPSLIRSATRWRTHALPSRIKERMLGSVLAQRCLDLLLLDLITVAFGAVESGFAALKRAGVSAGAWRGRACMCGPSPSLALPRRTLLPRHSNTDAHDCVHTSPCIPWCAQTWHAGTRAHTFATKCAETEPEQPSRTASRCEKTRETWNRKQTAFIATGKRLVPRYVSAVL